MNYYNEWDKHAAAWLRELIKDGLIPAGEVDERSVEDVHGSELKGFTQCHFFAGIGGWAEALRIAGVPADWPIWTASCPCQPWSLANVWEGGGKGFADARHCAPALCRLVRECSPIRIIGEQVAGAINKGWLDGIFAELEAAGYACGAVVFPSCSVGARHQRSRLYWCANARSQGRTRHQPVERIPAPAKVSFAFTCDNLARSWRAVDGDINGLLHCDGLSVVMERSKLKGYGNAIVPAQAAEFIGAYLETQKEPPCKIN